MAKGEPKPLMVPDHETKAGLGKIIAQAIALAVALANHFGDLGFPFDEADALVVIGLLEGVWQAKRVKEAGTIKRQMRRSATAPQQESR